MLILVSPWAHSVMYRWVDQYGAITYSDKPPPQSAVVRELTVIDGPRAITPHEKRTMDLIEAERRTGDPASYPADVPWRSGIGGIDAARDPQRESETPRSAGGGEPGLAPRGTMRPLQSEAVQDPCLRSSDPKCYERNRNAYVPYLGYAPSAARPRSEPLYGVGATLPAAGGGSVGGAVTPAPVKAGVPRVSPLPLRQSLKDAKDLK